MLCIEIKNIKVFFWGGGGEIGWKSEFPTAKFYSKSVNLIQLTPII